MQIDLGNGVNLRYEVYGSGYPLILIVGFGATLDLWSRDFIDPLAESYQVIAFDNRGICGSSAPQGPITMGLYAKDVVALMDRLGLAKAHVLGISMGGMIAQHLVVGYPDRVSKLVLGATTCSAKLVRKNPRIVGLLLMRWAPRFAMRSMVSKEFIATHPQLIARLAQVARSHPASIEAIRRQTSAVNQATPYGPIRRKNLPHINRIDLQRPHGD
ncbi:MAG: alpha/beta hydrolase [Proteobacteria bacterium]|nr:alpha/beta hydrolase [Pseudomonadota bacterium]